jgi:hypothetical protein
MSDRYHLDEHIDPAVAAGLRGRGIDVTTSNDAGLLSADDVEHLRFAFAKPRRSDRSNRRRPSSDSP